MLQNAGRCFHLAGGDGSPSQQSVDRYVIAKRRDERSARIFCKCWMKPAPVSRRNATNVRTALLHLLRLKERRWRDNHIILRFVAGCDKLSS